VQKSFSLAVKNVAAYGDTDVFPFPIENAMFQDNTAEIVELLLKIERASDFETNLERYPLTSVTHLAAAGYSGFRAVTQIDPLWNAYLLGAVVALGVQIEAARIAGNENSVFAYRFMPDHSTSSLFDRNSGWRQFQLESVKRAQSASFVVSCDISDFYSRIYHHRIENALKRATSDHHLVPRIMKVLMGLSKGTSYGLPIGGPAARLLSELLLNSVDHLLRMQGIRFTRFVDDYYLFADTKQNAYRYLLFLSEKLHQNEGLSLQRAKSRIMTTQEFLATSDFTEQEGPSTESERANKKLRSISLYFDPYSQTAGEDYERLRQSLLEFDIAGMLQEELRKSRIHQPTARKLMAAIPHLDVLVKRAAVETMLENLELLAPVFPSVMMVLKDLVRGDDQAVQTQIFPRMRALFFDGPPLISLPGNVAFYLRVLAYDRSPEADQILTSVFEKTESPSSRRDIINIMTLRANTHWLSDRIKVYETSTLWERRAHLVASFVLGDEGSHWRKRIKAGLSEYDQILLGWAGARKQAGRTGLPL